MNLFEFLRDRNHKDPLSRQRLLPSQPDGTTPDRVYAGSDIGEVHFTGDKPEAGDFTVIVGHAPRAVALSPQTPGLGIPLFNNPCKCHCGSSAGTIFWANPIHYGPYIVVMEGKGNFLQTLNPPQMYRVAGLAADGAAPSNLYVLDDRTRLGNFVTDASPDSQIAGISTYALHTFANTGTGYTWASVVELPDPGIPASPGFTEEMEWVTKGAASGMLADPPATYPTNCMAVIDGALYITMSMAPARYLRLLGGAFTTHVLLLNGSAFAKGLRGQVVTGIARPGKAASRFLIARTEAGAGEPGAGGFELIEFDAQDNIIQHFTNDGTLVSPSGLFVMCNQVIALSAKVYGRTEDGSDRGLTGTQMLGTGGPPAAVTPGLLIDDFCRTGRLSRISKQTVFPGPLAGVAGTAATVLGCVPIIASQQSPVNNAVLSTLTKTGGYDQALLTTPRTDDRGQPGPTSHLYAVPGAPLITGSTGNPFPLAPGTFDAQYRVGGDLWFTESGGVAQLVDSNSHGIRGFGGGFGPYWALRLPPNRVFNGVGTGRLENHTYDNYLLMPVVSFPQEPLSLNWNRGLGVYQWAEDSGLLFNLLAGRGADATFWLGIVQLVEVSPALVSSTGPTLSGALTVDGFLNGADLHRFYCYSPLATAVTMPNFGGTLTAAYTVPGGGLRPGLVVYSTTGDVPTPPPEIFFGSFIGTATQPTAFSLTIEGIAATPAAVTIPLADGEHQYDQAMSFAIPTHTVKTDLSGNTFVGLDWSLSVSGGYTGSGTLRYGPLNPTAEWLATPRYYEANLFFWFLTPSG